MPLAPWSGGPVADLKEAQAAGESIGYPLMVKATAGGGGRGIRLVRSPDQLDEAFERASSEAAKTAGDATVFLERAIRGGHHVEVQVIADAKGTVTRQARLVGGRDWVRTGAAELALDCLRRHLLGLPVDERIDFERR